MRRSSQQRSRCAPGSLGRAWLAAWVFILSAGCNSGLEQIGGPEGPSLSDPMTDLEPQSDEGGSDAADGAAQSLFISAKRVFCCDPLAVDFAVQTAEPMLPAGARVEWDFGDGKSASGSSVQHAYMRPGRYRVVLLVTWADGRSEEVAGLVEVGGDSDSDDLLVDPSSDDGGSDEDEATARIAAHAGRDQDVAGGEEVVLDGSASTFSGVAEVDVAWVQRQGPPADLRNDDQLRASFTAPQTQEDVVLVFMLLLSAGELQSSDEVRVTVRPPTGSNHAPVADGDSVAGTAGEAVLIRLSGSDADGDALTFRVVTPPSQGRLGPIEPLASDAAQVEYLAADDADGQDALEFVVSDGQAESAPARVVIDFGGGGTAPEARDGEWFVPVNTTARITFKGHDAEGDDLTFVIVSGPRHGELGRLDNSARDSATATYIPDPEYHGTDVITFQVTDGQNASSAARVELTVNKLLLPWMEVNLPYEPALDFYTEEQGAREGMTVLDFAMVGIENYARYTNTVVISTSGSVVHSIYREIEALKPRGLRIVGGIKTAAYLPPDDFASAAGWAAITEKAILAARDTQTNIVLLENETALNEFNGGRASIDLDRLRESIRPLVETGIELWWWLPNVQRNRDYWPERRKVTAEVTAAVLDMAPNSRFLTSYTSWLQWEDGVWEEPSLREEMIDIVGLEHYYDRHLVTRSGMRQRGEYMDECYTAQQSLDAMTKLPNDQLIIYPGGTQWIWVSEDYDALLPDLADVDPPF